MLTIKQIGNTTQKILFLLLFFSTLLYATDLPFSGYNGFLWLIFSLSLILSILNLHKLRSILKYHRYTLLFLICLYIWMWISAYFSEFQNIALKYSARYSIYALIFFAFLILTYKKEKAFLFHRLTLWSLLILALSGIIEYVFPEFRLFSLIRPVSSLRSFPRVSSLMQWPNQFGVLMGIGVLLALILYKKRIITATKFYPSLFLFIVVISLSASKNSWFVLLLGILFAWLYRTIKLREVFFIVGVLSLFILFFPISTERIGIKDSNIFPLFNLLNKFRESKPTSFIKNGSFEKLDLNLSPRYWNIWDSSCGYNFPRPQITTDAVDGRFSLKINTDKLAVFLNQQISQEVARKLCNSYKELKLRAVVKTASPGVTLGLRLSGDKIIYSKPHPGDGQWHELVLHVKTTECSENSYPRAVILSIKGPQSEASFDEVTFTGEGQKEKISTDNISYEKTINKQLIKSARADDIGITKSYRGRKRLWQTILKTVPDIPFTGLGIQTFQASGIGKEINGKGFLHAHNIILNILIELGFPGLLLSIVFIISILKKAEWSDPLVIIPLIMIFAGQMVDCFIHDFTFTTVALYFLSEAANSRT